MKWRAKVKPAVNTHRATAVRMDTCGLIVLAAVSLVVIIETKYLQEFLTQGWFQCVGFVSKQSTVCY